MRNGLELFRSFRKPTMTTSIQFWRYFRIHTSLPEKWPSLTNPVFFMFSTKNVSVLIVGSLISNN